VDEARQVNDGLRALFLPQHGRRPWVSRPWWFICPRTDASGKLYLPNGAFTFAARQAYRCQRDAPHDRALRRAFKLWGKLGADGGIGDPVPKPKWMRWRPVLARALFRARLWELGDLVLPEGPVLLIDGGDRIVFRRNGRLKICKWPFDKRTLVK